jgi:hypothetical protein
VLHAVHRQVADNDVYFVANASQRSGWIDCRFRVSNRTPELWHADAGRREPAALFSQDGPVTRVPLFLEPAGSVFVVFRPGPASDHATDLRFSSASAAVQAAPLRIVRAGYGPPNDAARTRDVTEQLTKQIKHGRLRFRAFTALAGDPAPGIRKELRVEYELGNGQRRTVAPKDGELLILPEPTGTLDGELLRDGNRTVLRAWQAGRFEVKWSTGETRNVDVPTIPAPVSAAGPWELSFPPGWGAPEHVTLPQLISWPKHAESGVRFFSGTATYRTTLDIPQDRFAVGQASSLPLPADSQAGSLRHAAGQSLHLNLGDVQVIAEVKLNGQDLGILWKPPFRVDVTKLARPGPNDLEVRVTNLWPNRLIGDEQYPDDCSIDGKWTSGGIPSWPEWLLRGQPRPEPRRLTFTALKHWSEDDRLLPSGLLGPVTVVTAVDRGLVP